MVNYAIEERIALITLNRPEKRNALNGKVVSLLKEKFKKAIENKQVKVIVLKANGKVFSAGADLAYLQQLQNNTYQENLEDSNNLKELFELIYNCPKIVIAQVQGHAIAGGFGLTTVCDFVFSVPEAKFGYTEVKIGFIPAIVMVFLLRKIGEAKARELLLTGNLIEAEDAFDCNLINYVFDEDDLEERVMQFAERMCETTSQQAIATTKAMIAKVPELSFNEALNYAAEQNAKARASEDCQRGIAAFLNKQKIEW